MTSKSLYWEDFTLDRRWQRTAEQTIDLEHIVSFALEYDPLAFHIDPERAPHTPVGVHCASGIQTLGMAQRLMCEAFLLDTEVVAGAGIEQLRFTAPVVPGDRLQLQVRVVEATAHERRSDSGWVWFEVQVATQVRTALVYRICMLVMRRAPAT